MTEIRKVAKKVEGDRPRSTFIGASEIGGIVGVDQYSSPIKVYMRKVHPDEVEEPDIESDEMEAAYWGTVFEPQIRNRYRHRHPDVTVLHPVGTWVRRDADHHAASPDGLILNVAPRIDTEHMTGPDSLVDVDDGLEIKTAGPFAMMDWDWEVADGIPMKYLCQCQWGMHVTGLDRWQVAVLFHGQKYREFRVTRNDALIGLLVDAVDRFWHFHVLRREPPKPDGSTPYTEHLNKTYPENVVDEYLVVEDETPPGQAIEELWFWRSLKKYAETCETSMIQTIKSYIQDSSGIIGRFGKIHWKKPKPTESVRWDAVAIGLRDRLCEEDPSRRDLYHKIYAEQVKDKRVVKENTRRFTPKFKASYTAPAELCFARAQAVAAIYTVTPDAEPPAITSEKEDTTDDKID